MASWADRIDTWIGKRLFVPLIIRGCQRFGCSQFTVSRVCWLVVFLISFYFALGWWEKWLFGLFALGASLTAGLSSATSPEPTWRWFRLMVLASVFLQLPVWVAEGPDYHVATSLLILIAEYAATIRTIPPLEAKEKRTGARRLSKQSA